MPQSGVETRRLDGSEIWETEREREGEGGGWKKEQQPLTNSSKGGRGGASGSLSTQKLSAW